MNKIDLVEQFRLRKDVPPFRPGDQVKVHVKVTEGTRERIQVFEGIVLGRRGGGLRESFKVRKISFGVGVERTFPLHGPGIDKIEIVRHGKVRRAKLYYLRDRIGRAAKIDERRTRISGWSPEDVLVAEPEPAAEEGPISDAPPEPEPEPEPESESEAQGSDDAEASKDA